MKRAARLLAMLAGAAVIFGISAAWGPAESPAPPPSVEFALQVDDQFRFLPDHFTCAPGASVRLTIVNALPAGGLDLPHNVLVLAAGTNTETFSTAALQASAESNYIPSTFAGHVLAASPLLHPAQRYELAFTAPAQPGEYPIICSFPGHCMLGMQGRLVVRNQP